MWDRSSRGIAGLAALLATPAALLRLAWIPGLAWSELPMRVATASPEQSLPLLLALLACCVAGWVALTVVVALAAELPGRLGRLSSTALGHVAPVAVRRLAEAVLGTSALLATTAGMAQAAGPAPRPAAAAAAAELMSALPAGLAGGLDRPAVVAPTAGPTFTLDRPADPARGLPLVSPVPTRTAAAQALPEQVTVAPGDSLWRIAARSLPPGAGEVEIQRAWHRWYEANSLVIGPDPGLLQPGQQLTVPQP